MFSSKGRCRNQLDVPAVQPCPAAAKTVTPLSAPVGCWPRSGERIPGSPARSAGAISSGSAPDVGAGVSGRYASSGRCSPSGPIRTRTSSPRNAGSSHKPALRSSWSRSTSAGSTIQPANSAGRVRSIRARPSSHSVRSSTAPGGSTTRPSSSGAWIACCSDSRTSGSMSRAPRHGTVQAVITARQIPQRPSSLLYDMMVVLPSKRGPQSSLNPSAGWCFQGGCQHARTDGPTEPFAPPIYRILPFSLRRIQPSWVRRWGLSGLRRVPPVRPAPSPKSRVGIGSEWPSCATGGS